MTEQPIQLPTDKPIYKVYEIDTGRVLSEHTSLKAATAEARRCRHGVEVFTLLPLKS